jgi:hypothetical protein
MTRGLVCTRRRISTSTCNDPCQPSVGSDFIIREVSVPADNLGDLHMRTF